MLLQPFIGLLEMAVSQETPVGRKRGRMRRSNKAEIKFRGRLDQTARDPRTLKLDAFPSQCESVFRSRKNGSLAQYLVDFKSLEYFLCGQAPTKEHDTPSIRAIEHRSDDGVGESLPAFF
jgi:hypothetical protein